jgi:uncharacterized protein YcfL
MKNIFLLAIFSILIFACTVKKDIVRIDGPMQLDDSVQYELIINEPGYDSWMATNSKPEWYHEKAYYRNWNNTYTVEFNSRVRQTSSGHPFVEIINYDPQIDYGLDIDYRLYWYFKYIEHKYNTRLHISSR